MAYATFDELKSAAGEERLLRMHGGNTQEISKSYFERRLLASSAMIDSWLSRRYTVPIDTTGNTELAALLSHATICCVLYQLATANVDVPEGIEKAWRHIKDWLDMIAAGKLELPGADASSSASAFAIVGTCRPLIRQSVFDLSDVLEEV